MLKESRERQALRAQKLFGDMVTLHPHQKLTPEEREALRDDYVKVCERLGFPTFKAAVEEAHLVCKWIPRAADIWASVPEPQLGKAPSHPQDCPQCGGTGFVGVCVPQGRKERHFIRCRGSQTQTQGEE